jgi:hypothetical protein
MSGTLKVGGKTLATHDTAANEISFHSDVMATTAQVQGVYTTATTAKATNANQLTSVTAVSGYSLADINVGDYVTGEGILVGTTVSAISGTTITLYHPDGDALSSSMTDLSGDPVSFYNATKALSPGTVAGGLCRAWGCIDGNGTILSAYNVSSVSGTSVNYTVNFLTNMPTDDYAVVVGLKSNYSNNTRLPGIFLQFGSTTSTSAFTLQSALGANASSAGVTYSHDEFYFAVFR